MFDDNKNSVRVTEAEAAQMQRMREEHARNKQTITPGVQVAIGGHGGSIVDGNVTTRNKYAVVHTSNPDERIVMINGMECARDTYEFLKSTHQLPPNAVIHFPFVTPPAKRP